MGGWTGPLVSERRYAERGRRLANPALIHAEGVVFRAAWQALIQLAKDYLFLETHVRPPHNITLSFPSMRGQGRQSQAATRLRRSDMGSAKKRKAGDARGADAPRPPGAETRCAVAGACRGDACGEGGRRHLGGGGGGCGDGGGSDALGP
eukprot:363645-Chlamydomonas_euryale.AAC.3